ncbi:MAG TPA: HD domain-containing protein [Firmicutes bacterium]|nr:HD domain-containing protein [Bacillota bacterium]
MGPKAYTIPVFDLLMSLGTAIDLLSPRLSGHHMRVAYISLALATTLKLDDLERRQLVIAAMIHDIGAFTEAERIELLRFEADDNDVHATVGFEFLRRFPLFREIAQIVRFHHLDWADGRGSTQSGESVPRMSHLLHLADRVDAAVGPERHILVQADNIRRRIESGQGAKFRPDHVGAFLQLSRYESFWLDLTFPNLEVFLARDTSLGELKLSIEQLTELAQLFCHLIDFKSPYTATHSSGVAATAAAIAGHCGFSTLEQREIAVSGLLHDLGKLALPAEILNKPAALTDEEFSSVQAHAYYSKRMLEGIRDLATIVGWGCAHHERLDGRGYPFHDSVDELPLGARIVAVADVLTALSEDRPYRGGMTQSQVVQVLEEMAGGGKLDGQLVALVREHFDDIQQRRSSSQRAASSTYRELAARLPLPSVDRAHPRAAISADQL